MIVTTTKNNHHLHRSMYKLSEHKCIESGWTKQIVFILESGLFYLRPWCLGCLYVNYPCDNEYKQTVSEYFSSYSNQY